MKKKPLLSNYVGDGRVQVTISNAKVYDLRDPTKEITHTKLNRQLLSYV